MNVLDKIIKESEEESVEGYIYLATEYAADMAKALKASEAFFMALSTPGIAVQKLAILDHARRKAMKPFQGTGGN